MTKSNRKSNRTGESEKVGKTLYQYDEDGNLTNVDGPYFNFVYSYGGSQIKKYEMQSDIAVMDWDGPDSYKHKLKYRAKINHKSVYNPDCPGFSLLSSGDK